MSPGSLQASDFSPGCTAEHFNKLNEYKLLVVMVLSLNQSATPSPSQCILISLQAPWYRILPHCKLLSWSSGGKRNAEGLRYLSYTGIPAPDISQYPECAPIKKKCVQFLLTCAYILALISRRKRRVYSTATHHALPKSDVSCRIW